MLTFFASKKRQQILVIVASFLVSLVVGLTFFLGQPCAVYSEQSVSLLNNESVRLATKGYTIDGMQYTQTESDPQLVFSNMSETFDYVLVSFDKPLYGKAYVQAFYHEEGKSFNAQNATKQTKVPFGASHVVLRIPEATYAGLRMDIDGNFVLNDIVVSPDPIKITRAFTGSFSFMQWIAMSAALSAVGVLFVNWIHKPQSRTKLSNWELVFCAACFVFYTLWAVAKPITYSPDEQMRFEVTQFLFAHNRLPVNEELISEPWGFSYAHFPTVLCNQLGYVFMKIASLFMTGDFKLLIAARMVSVCAGTGVVYFVIKASKLLLISPARFIMIAFVAFMPQFAFLSSYVNNDSLALLGVAMIVYSWVRAIELQWDYKSGFILAIGVAICGLSYYNSYPWILLSVLFFVVSYYYQNRKNHKDFTRLLTFIVIVVVALVGYSFIRHLVLYGDLFGFKVRRYYGELYAVEALKPSVTQSPVEKGVSFHDVMFAPPYEYVKKTWQSFVGVFSFMSVFCPKELYDIVLWIVWGAVAGLVVKLAMDIVQKKRPQPMKVLMVLCMIISSSISIGLAVYKSYTGDFQPQGRYCYPAFIAIAYLVAKGYEAVICRIRWREQQYAVTAIPCTVLAMITMYAYSMVFLPS